MMFVRAVLVIALILCVSSTSGLGQLSDEDQVGDLLTDVLAPDSPALASLGITGQDIIRPDSPTALATTILNGVDTNGNFQTGLAIDFSPYLLFAGHRLTLADYKENTLRRQVSRFQTSLALTKGASDDDEAARAAIGFRWTPFDTGDPFLAAALQECFRKLRPALLPDVPPHPDPDVEATLLEKRLEEFNEAIDECRVSETPSFDESQSLQLTVAPLFFSDSGETGDFESQGFAATATYAVGLKAVWKALPSGQVVGGIGYRLDEPAPTEEGRFVEQDRANAGVRLIFGDPARWFAGVEGSYQHIESDENGSDDFFKYVGSLDVRIAGNVWLNVSLGGESGRNNGEDDLFALSRLKWNFGERPALDPDALAVSPR